MWQISTAITEAAGHPGDARAVRAGRRLNHRMGLGDAAPIRM